MDEKKTTNLSIYIDPAIKQRLDECSRLERRTKRAVVEIALEQYFENSPALSNSGKGGAK